MSAVKLEKKVAALERRLQDEMCASIEPLIKRLDQIEEQLRFLGQSTDLPSPKAKVEHLGSRVDLGTVPKESSVVPEEPSLQVGNWTKVVKDEEPSKVIDIAEVDVDEEPIPFAETVWNLVLVLGHTDGGWLDLIIASLLTLLGTFMQVIFVTVLLSDFFLGESMEDHERAAQQWRAGSAHDVKYMDLALTSLVSRVCSGDGSLILSTGQAALIEEINQFLGLGQAETAPRAVSPGVTLCMLCITLWCVILGGEFRAIATSFIAASQIPRGRKTIMDKGRFVSISYLRFACYLLFRLARTAVAGCLLFAGAQWLARTTSISELILNAVALEAILQILIRLLGIDEIVFAALFPKKVQTAIYELEPIRVQYTRLFGQAESCAVFTLMCAAVIVPYFVWVLPISEMMFAVKVEYCGGNQDFVVSFNQEMQVYMGFPTVPYGNVSDDALGHLAVTEHAKERLLNETFPKYIVFSESLDSFESSRFRSMSSAATNFPFCLDYDSWTSSLLIGYGAHFRSAAVQLGHPNATSCGELAGYCDQLDARLLRMVCGPSCGCANPHALPWFKVPSQGCSAACREEARQKAGELPCSDANNTENWDKFWKMYPSVMSIFKGQDLLASEEGTNILGLVDMMTTLGCLGLSVIGSTDFGTGANWCEGSEELFGPLALICASPCGCTGQNPSAGCSPSCTACGDATTFPANPSVSNCQEAQALGFCENVPSEAKLYCSGTCGLCNGTANVSTVCQDGVVPPEILNGIDCSMVQANGWCGPLVFLNSPLGQLCSKSCGLCS